MVESVSKIIWNWSKQYSIFSTRLLNTSRGEIVLIYFMLIVLNWRQRYELLKAHGHYINLDLRALSTQSFGSNPRELRLRLELHFIFSRLSVKLFQQTNVAVAVPNFVITCQELSAWDLGQSAPWHPFWILIYVPGAGHTNRGRHVFGNFLDFPLCSSPE